MVSFTASTLAFALAIVTAAPTTPSGSLSTATLNARDTVSDGARIDNARNALANTQNTIQSLTAQLQSNPGRHSASDLSSILTSLDAELERAADAVDNAIAPFDESMETAVGNFLLAPVASIVTENAESLVGNLIGGDASVVDQTDRDELSKTLQRFVTLAQKFDVDTNRLDAASSFLLAYS